MIGSAPRRRLIELLLGDATETPAEPALANVTVELSRAGSAHPAKPRERDIEANDDAAYRNWTRDPDTRPGDEVTKNQGEEDEWMLDPDPRPGDVITEANGDEDAWMLGPDPRPGDLDTKSCGEQDEWILGPDPRPGDTETRDDGEQDQWLLSLDPRPEGSDIETASREEDGWRSSLPRLAAADPDPQPGGHHDPHRHRD